MTGFNEPLNFTARHWRPFCGAFLATLGFSTVLAATVHTTASSRGLPDPAAMQGLRVVDDPQNRVARHACAQGQLIDTDGDQVGDKPCGFVEAPDPAGIIAAPANMINDIKVLVRRDAAILYLPVVAGAKDYRAYVVSSPSGSGLGGVTFVEGDPKNAMMVCAGYRQHPRTLADDSTHTTINYELMRQLELPGLKVNGTYKVVIEAVDRVCPFSGVPGYKDGVIPVVGSDILKSVMGTSFAITSFSAAKTANGNEIINGQGAPSAFDQSLTPGKLRGQALSYTIPNVLARATIKITTPFPDEVLNARLLDLAAPENSGVFDDFRADGSVSLHKNSNLSDTGSQTWVEGKDANWFYWVNRANKGVGDTDSDAAGKGITGAQIWKRHGRLNMTLTDWGQDVMSAIHFTSLVHPTRAMSDTAYIHSFWRADVDTTMRRYWTWMMCGAATDATLIDANTGQPRVRYNDNAFFYENNGGSDDAVPDTVCTKDQVLNGNTSSCTVPGVAANGVNPSIRKNDVVLKTDPQSGREREALPLKPLAQHNQECVQLMQFDGMYQPQSVNLAAGGQQTMQTESSLRLMLHPQGKPMGIHSMLPTFFSNNTDGYLAGAVANQFVADTTGRFKRTLLDDFAVPNLLAHFDLYARSDRVVLFVNGRMATCWKFDKKLAMKRAKIVYGQVLYHTDAEYNEYHFGKDGYRQKPGAKFSAGQFNYAMNTPAADYRTWDAVGESENVTVPDPVPGRTPDQGGYDDAQCTVPDPANYRMP